MVAYIPLPSRLTQEKKQPKQILFFCIESMFAVGTTNWGTAARHHILTSGLIVILAFFTSKYISESPEVILIQIILVSFILI